MWGTLMEDDGLGGRGAQGWQPAPEGAWCQRQGREHRGVLGEGRTVGSVQILLNLGSICNVVL